MPLTVVLAVDFDSSLLATKSPVWESAGYVVTAAGSIAEAGARFQDGDFDLVLLGHSIPVESRKRFTSLIRATGSKIPVVYVSQSPSDRDLYADATIRDEPIGLLRGIREIMASRASAPAANRAVTRIAT